MEADGSTRSFETLHGSVDYPRLNDLIAQPYRETFLEILDGTYDSAKISVDLLKSLHRRFVQPVMPKIAGKWRTTVVSVGHHMPPPPETVDREMHLAMDALNARLHFADDPDLQIEALAYAECALLHIHPFADFNGRAVRLLCWLIAIRLRLPVAHTWVDAGTPAHGEYSAALREFDLHANVIPMAHFWKAHRF